MVSLYGAIPLDWSEKGLQHIMEEEKIVLFVWMGSICILMGIIQCRGMCNETETKILEVKRRMGPGTQEKRLPLARSRNRSSTQREGRWGLESHAGQRLDLGVRTQVVLV